MVWQGLTRIVKASFKREQFTDFHLVFREGSYCTGSFEYKCFEPVKAMFAREKCKHRKWNKSWWVSLTQWCSGLLWAPTGHWSGSLHRSGPRYACWPARAMTQLWQSHHPLSLCSEVPLHSLTEHRQLCVSTYHSKVTLIHLFVCGCVYS